MCKVVQSRFRFVRMTRLLVHGEAIAGEPGAPMIEESGHRAHPNRVMIIDEHISRWVCRCERNVNEIERAQNFGGSGSDP